MVAVLPLVPLTDVVSTQDETGLRSALRAVATHCTINAWGHIDGQSCDPRIARRLIDAEKAVSQSRAMLDYCRLLQGPGRRLASYRLDLLGVRYDPRRPGDWDEETFECLEEQLTADDAARADERVVRTFTVLGTALGKLGETLDVLDSLPPGRARRAGRGALWAHGRLEALATLRSVLATSQDTQALREIIEGFGRGAPLAENEREAVCGTLRLLVDHDSLTVAGPAMLRLALDCRLMARAVLQAAEFKLAQRKVDFSMIEALRSLAERGPSQTRAQAIALLQTVVANTALSNGIRQRAAWAAGQ